MPDADAIVTVVAIFALAGVVKGVIGLGLPTVSLALITVAIDLPTAMAVVLVPSLVANLWQAVVGGGAGAVLRRIWPFLLMAAATVWIGAMALTRVELSWLSAMLGVLLVVYSAVSLGGVRFSVGPRHEVWAGPLVGGVNGVLAGMTGSFVVPGVLYLQAIGLSRDALVRAMGMLFGVSTLALGVALRGQDMLGVEHAALSAMALIPAILGMVVGQRIRQRLCEPAFRRALFFSLLLLGAYIAARELGGQLLQNLR